MKKKRKYSVNEKLPSMSKTIQLRMTEKDHQTLIRRALESPEGNLSCYCRRKLMKGDNVIGLSVAERELLEGLQAARTDIIHFASAVDAATKNKPEDFRKQYILSLGVQQIWSKAIARVFNYIDDMLVKYQPKL